MDLRRNPKTPLAVPGTTPHVRGVRAYTVDPTRPINPATGAALYDPAPPIGQASPPWSLGSSSSVRGYTVDPTRPINPATGAALYEPAPPIGQASPPGPLGSPIKDPLTSIDKGDLTPGAFPQGLPSAQPSLTRPRPPGLAPSPHVLEPPPSLRVLAAAQLQKITNRSPAAQARGLAGTDLGVPVEHNGHLYLFFGDAELWHERSAKFIRPMATASAAQRKFGGLHISVRYLVDANNGLASFDVNDLDNTSATYSDKLAAAQVSPQIFDVPTGAFSYRGSLHVFRMRQAGFNNDANGRKLTLRYVTDTIFRRGVVGGRSVLESASDPLMFSGVPYATPPVAPIAARCVEVCDIRHFDVDELRTKWKFSQVCPQVARGADIPELGVTGDALLLWGTGAFRQSDVCFAWAPLSVNGPIPPPAEWRYLSGSSGGRAQFTHGVMESAIGLLTWSDRAIQSNETSFERSEYRPHPLSWARPNPPSVGEFRSPMFPPSGRG